MGVVLLGSGSCQLVAFRTNGNCVNWHLKKLSYECLLHNLIN
jgi:hypothetical protein